MPGGSTASGGSAWLAGLIAVVAGLAAPTSYPVAGPVAVPLRAEAVDPTARALHAMLADGAASQEVQGFYAARGYWPLWTQGRHVRPEAGQLIAALRRASADNLDPSDYAPDDVAAAVRAAHGGSPEALARAELALSGALAAYAADLHRARSGAEMLYTDAGLHPTLTTGREALDAAARGRTLAQGLAAALRTNPIYGGLRTALATAVAHGGPNVELIRANLERARALPVDLGRRFILVDVTAQRLWAFENGRPVDSMRVVVGKVSEPTPALAGVIRYAVFRPYWNVPPDLVRDSIAPKVLSQGVAYFAARHFEALSDWTDQAQVLDPKAIDWKAVASGRTELRVRQRPGPDNMMGQMKFMFPNALGVYLHDTPLKALFVDGQRTASAGCVRLEDAARVGRWLLSPQAVTAGREPGAPESRVDLAEPVPVYLVYFTAAPTERGLDIRPDIYRRDAPLLASLQRAGGGADQRIASR